jgi:hypothetical protein
MESWIAISGPPQIPQRHRHDLLYCSIDIETPLMNPFLHPPLRSRGASKRDILLYMLNRRKKEEQEEQEQEEERRRKFILMFMCAGWTALKAKNAFRVINRRRNRRNVNYASVVKDIKELRRDPKTFSRMYRLSVKSFDTLLHTISEQLKPLRAGGRNVIPPLIKLAVALRFLAGGSYLDLSFGYKIPRSTIHFYIFQVLQVMDDCEHPFLNNIISPIHRSDEDLQQMEMGFAAHSFNKLKGTVAAGDGIVIQMIRPTNEEAAGDVTTHYNRKKCYAVGVQVRGSYIFCICR